MIKNIWQHKTNRFNKNLAVGFGLNFGGFMWYGWIIRNFICKNWWKIWTPKIGDKNLGLFDFLYIYGYNFFFIDFFFFRPLTTHWLQFKNWCKVKFTQNIGLDSTGFLSMVVANTIMHHELMYTFKDFLSGYGFYLTIMNSSPIWLLNLGWEVRSMETNHLDN